MMNHGDAAAQQAYNMPRPIAYQKAAADAAAATATAEQPFFAAPFALLVTAISVLPAAALVADNANNATITIRRRDVAGANPATVASITTNVASGNWTQHVAKALVLGAGVRLAAGEILTFEVTKAGTGVVVPAGAYQATAIPD